MNEPTTGLQRFQSIKQVLAGEIVDVVDDDGCYVKQEDGTSIFREFISGMTARYTPVPGDFWVVYDNEFQSISPRQPFVDGYVSVGSTPT